MCFYQEKYRQINRRDKDVRDSDDWAIQRFICFMCVLLLAVSWFIQDKYIKTT